MTVEDALAFYQAVPVIARKLQTLDAVGLSYIKLGQNATTLSGGEAQRVKLARELSKRDTGQTLYILDEPTTGLHFHDIEQLLQVLHELRDRGNTIVVIEHNLEGGEFSSPNTHPASHRNNRSVGLTVTLLAPPPAATTRPATHPPGSPPSRTPPPASSDGAGRV